MIICRKVYHIKICKSSLDLAKQILDQEADGTVILCNHIINARGRAGRVWNSAVGQALITIILKPVSSSQLHYLNMALAVGFLRVLRQYGVGLKWPNDFFVNGKKVGGMLIEIVWRGKDLKGII